MTTLEGDLMSGSAKPQDNANAREHGQPEPTYCDPSTPFLMNAARQHPETSLCFLGGFFDKDREAQIRAQSRGPVQDAANALQWLIIDGLGANWDGPLKLVTAPFIGSFPKRYTRPLLRSWSFQRGPGLGGVSIGFMNLPILKHFSRRRRVARELAKWARVTPGNKVVVAYSLNFSFMGALRALKTKHPEARVCVVVPDLPEFMNTSATSTLAYRLLKRLEISSMWRNFAAVDSLVLLTEAMRERLPDGPAHIVIEGVGVPIEAVATPKERAPERTVLYAGTLHERYGILLLLDAFELIDDCDLRLLICGDGDAAKAVREACARDARLRYLGILPREEVLDLERRATVLINPRTADEEFTRYSFPSKILEYMGAGRPVIAYELPGAPAEYRDYLIYVERGGAVALAESIVSVCRMDEEALDELGRRGQDFVKNHKSPQVQGAKILSHALSAKRAMT